ncbi:MAG TPA: MscL family protein [archaeon]|nr:MscL family protein [archaeon]
MAQTTSFVTDFLEFLKKYQVAGLAIAFIIGASSTKLVTALVNDIVMPIVNVLLPSWVGRKLHWL